MDRYCQLVLSQTSFIYSCWHAPGWFPFLFYGTTWVGEIYFRYSATSTPKDILGEVGRVGSLALIVFSIITLIGSVLLPWVVQSPEYEKSRSQRGFTPRPPPGIAPLVTTMAKYKPDLVTAWMYSHLIFAASMSLTPLVKSLQMATILVSICGMYAPFFMTPNDLSLCWFPTPPLTR